MAPLRRHSGNSSESKHGNVRSVFLKVEDTQPGAKNEFMAINAVISFYKIYWNIAPSTFGIEKARSKLRNGNAVFNLH